MTLADDVNTFCAAASSAAAPDQFVPRKWAEQDWTRLFECATRVSFAAGTPFMRRGESGSAMYFLVSGRVEIYTSDAKSMSIGPLSVIHPGSVIGEMAFFDGKPRSASVWAIDACVAYLLTAEQFAGFEADYPSQARDVLYALGKVLTARLRSADEHITR
jgi:CRP/FNR family transcriptional regulator, cyclic AMP receptor protein